MCSNLYKKLELRTIPHFLRKHYGEVVDCTEGNAIHHSLHRVKCDRSQNFTKRNAIDRSCLRGRFDWQREMRSIGNFHKEKCDRSKLLKREVWFHREKCDRSQIFTKKNAIDRSCLRGRFDSQREMRSIAYFHIKILRSIVLSIFHNYIFKIYKILLLLQTLRAFFQCTYKF